MKKLILKYSTTLSIIWALIIFGLCSMPGGNIPSFKWMELLSLDKWIHAGIFFVLCCLMFFAVKQRTQRKQMIYVLFTVAVLYGCLLEIMQYYVFIQRSADWYDIGANTVGCIFGLMFYEKLFLWMFKTA